MKGAREIAVVLAVLGCLVIFVAVGSESWPLVLGWLGGSLIVGLVWMRLTQQLRLGLAVALLPLCVLLTWEGGLFFVPSVIALIVASIPKRHSLPA